MCVPAFQSQAAQLLELSDKEWRLLCAVLSGDAASFGADAELALRCREQLPNTWPQATAGHLAALLLDSGSRASLLLFLSQNVTLENLAFVHRALMFRGVRAPDEQTEAAQRIHQLFLSPAAPCQINLSSFELVHIESQLAQHGVDVSASQLNNDLSFSDGSSSFLFDAPPGDSPASFLSDFSSTLSPPSRSSSPSPPPRATSPPPRATSPPPRATSPPPRTISPPPRTVSPPRTISPPVSPRTISPLALSPPSSPSLSPPASPQPAASTLSTVFDAALVHIICLIGADSLPKFEAWSQLSHSSSSSSPAASSSSPARSPSHRSKPFLSLSSSSIFGTLKRRVGQRTKPSPEPDKPTFP